MLEYKYQNFYEAIEDNAKRTPNKTLLLLDDEKMDNKEFKKRVDSFAFYLESSGIKSKDKVALIVANSFEFVVSLFAITKIGAVVVPINTFLKHEEFEYIVNDCSAKMLISSSSYSKETKNLLFTTSVESIVWVGDYDEVDDKNVSFSQILSSKEEIISSLTPPKLDDLACVVYTSGTTGKPKGAMLSYRNLYSNSISGQKAFNVLEKDRFLVFLPMFHSFTFSIMVVLPVVMNSSIIIVKSVFPFANVLKQALKKQATIFLGVPTLYNSLVKAKIPWYFMWFNKIRIFISGSAPLSEKVLNDFSKKFKKAVLTEGYGLSECSPVVTVNRLEKQKVLSVGIPLESYEIKIVNDEMVEVPVGEIGEIIVRGDCVMQGYLNRPDATDETIVNGWLLSGDLGKVDKDGFLFIVDRKKDLIISKGINVYPREIEEVLAHFDGVELSAVIGVKNELNDEEVRAFIQPKEDTVLDELTIKKYLKEHLANFKVPKHIYFVEELPKNATGKVLKRVLKEQLKTMMK